jgi:anti-sigma factor RsiW
MKNHLTTDELVDRLYGVSEPGHLDHCAECAERFRRLRELHETAAEPVPESYEFLAAQRRNIYARMGERPQTRMKWVPALAAAAFLAAVGMFAYHPSRQVAKPQIDDAQLFSDVYSMEQSMEPVAAKPIHAIFEQDQQ